MASFCERNESFLDVLNHTLKMFLDPLLFHINSEISLLWPRLTLSFPLVHFQIAEHPLVYVLLFVLVFVMAHYQEVPGRTDRLGPVLIRCSQAGDGSGTVQAL